MRSFLLLLAGLLAISVQAQPFKLTVTPIAPKFYVHTSQQLHGSSPFPSNGMIIDADSSVLLIDTAWDSEQTWQLLFWVEDNLKKPVKLCIITHAHDDRMAGAGILRKAGVRVISTALTATGAAGMGADRPEGILPRDTTFTLGKLPVRCFFPGEGHSRDNIVVWFPQQRILFGGCLVKSYAAFGMGNIADANLAQWANTVRHVMKQFPSPAVVVPGHEQWDKTSSLEHTLKLLEQYTRK